METTETGRCFLRVDLTALVQNYRDVRRFVPRETAVIAVLKADAYGLGARRVAEALLAEGVKTFAVATPEEGLALRGATACDVLVMGRTSPAFMDEAVARGLLLTVFDEDGARRLSDCARARGQSARVHLKIDTGLHRLGFDPDAQQDALQRVLALPNLSIEGVFTHLGLHTRLSDEFQLAVFLSVRAHLERALGRALTAHALDSIGVFRYPDHALSAVRIGAWLYGVAPSFVPRSLVCRPVAQFFARVAQVRAVAPGEFIGYDDEHPVSRPTRVATLACGYVDGYPRALSGCHVRVRGQDAPLLGRACMDMMMADVTDIPSVAAGDLATLFGDGLPLDLYARQGELNRNEALATIGARVPRIYETKEA